MKPATSTDITPHVEEVSTEESILDAVIEQTHTRAEQRFTAFDAIPEGFTGFDHIEDTEDIVDPDIYIEVCVTCRKTSCYIDPRIRIPYWHVPSRRSVR